MRPAETIVYLSSGMFYKGGIARYSRYQVAALRQIVGPQGVRVLSLMGRAPDDFEDPFAVDWEGPVSHGLQAKARMVGASLRFTAGLRRPVVWSNHVNLAPLAWMLARGSGGRYVVNTYGLELWSGMRAVRREALYRADHVVVDCHFSRKYLLDERMVLPERASTVWDPVDTERFSPGPPDVAAWRRAGVDWRPGGFRVVSCGRLNSGSRHKGFDRTIRMLAGLPRELRFEYVIVGDGDQRSVLAELAASLGIGDRVFFAGSVPDRDLPEFYRGANLAVLVSDRGEGRGEGIPLTPLEAAACGCPIFVGNQDGSQEAVEPGINGWVFDPFDLATQQRMVERLIRRPEEACAMGAAARLRIEREHSFEVFTERTRSVLHRFGGRSDR